MTDKHSLIVTSIGLLRQRTTLGGLISLSRQLRDNKPTLIRFCKEVGYEGPL